MIVAAISAPQTLQPYNEDGTYTVLAEEYPFVAVDLTNPLNYINEQHNEVKANVVLANAALIYNPIKELTIKISGGIENRDDREANYRSEEHTSELQSLMRNSYAVFCLKKNIIPHQHH